MQIHSPDLEDLQRYDPVFILRFAIHSLSVGFMEPVEFAGLGLLAVAFVSISSPDVGMRKLGYETLGRFKNELEVMLYLCLWVFFHYNSFSVHRFFSHITAEIFLYVCLLSFYKLQWLITP